MRPRRRELHHLTLDHVLREVDENVQDLEVAFLERHLKRLHVQPVAGQHAAMISPARICRGPPAARVGAVDHIVVYQGGTVNQFDHGTQTHCGGALIARVSGGKQQQCRAQAFPAAAQQVSGDLRDRFARVAGLLRQFLLRREKGRREPDRKSL